MELSPPVAVAAVSRTVFVAPVVVRPIVAAVPGVELVLQSLG